MKKVVILVGVLALISVGCVPKSLKGIGEAVNKLELPKPTVKASKGKPPTYYEGKTDAELLLESITGMNIKGLEIERARLMAQPILIASLENPADSEKNSFPAESDPVEEFVEDALTQLLTTKGFRVVERDLDIMTRLYHEIGKDYLISIAPDYSLEQFLVKPEEGKEFQKRYIRPPSNMAFIRYPFLGKVPLQKRAPLTAAGHVLSYRVLECGIAYRPTTKPLVNREGEEMTEYALEEKVERIAVSKIHLRITDERGITIWAEVVPNEASAVTLKKALPYMRTPVPQFNGFTNPVKELILDMAQESSAE